MRILVACEESQAVTIELRKLGHEAYSCDIIECSGGHPEWHIQGDVLPLLNGASDDFFCRLDFYTQNGEYHELPWKWDMIIGFPPCTHLANSGARHFEKKRLDGRQQQGIDFFMHIANANCARIAIENPVGIMSTKYRKPDQIIQPWQFALSDEEKTEKSTCLWLKGLQPLKPLHAEKPEIPYKEWFDEKAGRMKRQTLWYYNTRCLGPKMRAFAASKTFAGIAKAMAEQWAGEANEGGNSNENYVG